MSIEELQRLAAAAHAMINAGHKALETIRDVAKANNATPDQLAGFEMRVAESIARREPVDRRAPSSSGVPPTTTA